MYTLNYKGKCANIHIISFLVTKIQIRLYDGQDQ